jgi:ABC-type glutathione transport system ATPase component
MLQAGETKMMSAAPSPAATFEVAARTEGLTKIYGKGDAQVVALGGVSVDIHAHEFTAIMGPSGSGKSTLMHCAAGLDSVTAGTVTIGDVELTSLKEKALTQAAARPDRLHLPGLQPDPDADRRGEHPAAARHRRPQARPGVVRPGGRRPSA